MQLRENSRVALVLRLPAVTAKTILILAAAITPVGAQQSSPRPIEGGAIDVQYLAEEAPLGIRGTLSHSRVAWIGRTIYTFYDIVVAETLKGPAQAGVTIAVPGGAIDNVRTDWPGAPDLKIGQDIVFLGKPMPGRSDYMPLGLFDGIIQVETEQQPGDQVVYARGRPEKLEDFLREVRSFAVGRTKN